MSLAAIWAQGHRRAIGRDGTMPWHLPEDLRHFKRLTSGHPVIMGMTTWHSLGNNQPLPGRRNIVLSRSVTDVPGAETAASLDEARALVGDQLGWVMGGAQVYEAAMPYIDGIVVTDIDIDIPDADAFAPALPSWTDAAAWEIVGSDPDRGWHRSATGLAYRYTALTRIGTTPWAGDPLAH